MMDVHHQPVCQILRTLQTFCHLCHDVIALSSDKTILRFWKGCLQRTCTLCTKGVNRLQVSATCQQKHCVSNIYQHSTIDVDIIVCSVFDHNCRKICIRIANVWFRLCCVTFSCFPVAYEVNGYTVKINDLKKFYFKDNLMYPYHYGRRPLYFCHGFYPSFFLSFFLA